LQYYLIIDGLVQLRLFSRSQRFLQFFDRLWNVVGRVAICRLLAAPHPAEKSAAFWACCRFVVLSLLFYLSFGELGSISSTLLRTAFTPSNALALNFYFTNLRPNLPVHSTRSYSQLLNCMLYYSGSQSFSTCVTPSRKNKTMGTSVCIFNRNLTVNIKL